MDLGIRGRRALGQVWLLLSAFGICFVLPSSLQKPGRGAIVQPLGALAPGLRVYLTVGRPKQE